MQSAYARVKGWLQNLLRVGRNPIFILVTCCIAFGGTAILTWSMSPTWLAMPRVWAVMSGAGALSCLIAMTRNPVAVAAAGALVVVAAATRGTAILIDWVQEAPVDSDASAAWATSGLTWLGVAVWLLNVWADRITRWAAR